MLACFRFKAVAASLVASNRRSSREPGGSARGRGVATAPRITVEKSAGKTRPKAATNTQPARSAGVWRGVPGVRLSQVTQRLASPGAGNPETGAVGANRSPRGESDKVAMISFHRRFVGRQRRGMASGETSTERNKSANNRDSDSARNVIRSE